MDHLPNNKYEVVYNDCNCNTNEVPSEIKL